MERKKRIKDELNYWLRRKKKTKKRKERNDVRLTTKMASVQYSATRFTVLEQKYISIPQIHTLFESKRNVPKGIV